MKNSLAILISFILLLSSSVIHAVGVIPTDIYSDDTVYEEVSYNDWHYYKIDIENPAKLTVKLRKISNDVDLYVSHSEKPTKDSFQCAPHKEGASIETCRLTSHTAATWYIGIHGKQDSDYKLNVKSRDLRLLSQIEN